MLQTAVPKSRLLKALEACRAATVNLFVPILLAWLLTSVVHRRLHLSDPRPVAAEKNAFGPVKLRLKLPGTSAGIPEPLVVCGRTGNASLVYIRLLDGNRAKVGVEFWGLRADQSLEFPLPAADAVIEVVCYLPAFFPSEGDSYWAGLTEKLQRIRRGEYIIAVNGVVRLRAPVKYAQPAHPVLYFGENPIGGSLVSDRFSGVVLQAAQER
jgi:hypothetical protein